MKFIGMSVVHSVHFTIFTGAQTTDVSALHFITFNDDGLRYFCSSNGLFSYTPWNVLESFDQRNVCLFVCVSRYYFHSYCYIYYASFMHFSLYVCVCVLAHFVCFWKNVQPINIVAILHRMHNGFSSSFFCFVQLC